MDIEKLLEEKLTGVTLSDEDKTKVSDVIVTYENQILKLNSDLEFQKSESKKAFDKRDAIKTEFKSFKEQVITGQAPEVQELNKKVFDFETKFDSMEKELEDYKVKYTEVDTRIKDINEKKKTELLSSLPDGSEKKKFAEGLNDLDKLEDFVKLAKIETIGVDGGKGGGDLKLDPNKKWDDYSSKDLEEIKKKHPEAYKELYSKKYTRS